MSSGPKRRTVVDTVSDNVKRITAAVGYAAGLRIVTVLNPNAYPTAAVVRLTLTLTVSTTVRRFGPLLIEVLAP